MHIKTSDSFFASYLSVLPLNTLISLPNGTPTDITGNPEIGKEFQCCFCYIIKKQWIFVFVQSCSLQDPYCCWHLVAIEACTVGASGRYASYWNAFLFYNSFPWKHIGEIGKKRSYPKLQSSLWGWRIYPSFGTLFPWDCKHDELTQTSTTKLWS